MFHLKIDFVCGSLKLFISRQTLDTLLMPYRQQPNALPTAKTTVNTEDPILEAFCLIIRAVRRRVIGCCGVFGCLIQQSMQSVLLGGGQYSIA